MWDLRSRTNWFLLILGLGTLLATGSGAEVFMSQREAIEQAFPEADAIEKRTIVIDDASAKAIEERARARLESRLLTVHTGVKDGKPMGYAFIDVHPVRTLPEAFLIVVSPDGRVQKLKLLAFYEPPEYAPSKRWLRLFDDRALDPKLSLGGEIHTIAGSTLSSRAVTDSVRRSLAAWEVLLVDAVAEAAPGGGEDPQPGVTTGGK